MAAIEAARAKAADAESIGIRKITIVPMQIENVLRILRVTTKKFPTDEIRVRWEINSWAVEVALARLGDRQLTTEEQREVWNCTRMRHKVDWPDWWEVGVSK